MPSSTTNSAYLRGVRSSAPFILVVVPFGMLFGVVAIEAGLTLAQTMGFTSIVIAGAAQFAALGQMVENAPVAVIIATALAVNLRMAMYSASLAVHLGQAPLWQRVVAAYVNFDQTYSVSILEFERRPEMTQGEKFAFFMGSATPIAPIWIASSYLGAVIGGNIFDGLPLDFALPITFLALMAPILRTRAHVIAAFVAVVMSLATAWIPYNLGLLIAGLIAMMAGARAELYFAAREQAA